MDGCVCSHGCVMTIVTTKFCGHSACDGRFRTYEKLNIHVSSSTLLTFTFIPGSFPAFETGCKEATAVKVCMHGEGRYSLRVGTFSIWHI